jgi:hypothetical protein
MGMGQDFCQKMDGYGWFNIRKAGKYRKIDQHPLSSKIKLSGTIHHLLPDHS